MKIVVTGASGFVGRHVVAALLQERHEVIAVARNPELARSMPWYQSVDFVVQDIHDPTLKPDKTLGIPDALVHLAWPGLPHYAEPFHVDTTLPADTRFLESMVRAGTKQVLVTGTCLEYGLQSGSLSEHMTAEPVTAYGSAKNLLRQRLQQLQLDRPFAFQWVRLFYLYGPGQPPHSLLAQLERAIDRGDATFNMSGGEQQRDYLPIEEVARRLAWLVDHPECHGIINCCSGTPISIRALVEKRLSERQSRMTLNLGYYAYPPYEPMAFWGDGTKLTNCMRHTDEAKRH